MFCWLGMGVVWRAVRFGCVGWGVAHCTNTQMLRLRVTPPPFATPPPLQFPWVGGGTVTLNILIGIGTVVFRGLGGFLQLSMAILCALWCNCTTPPPHVRRVLGGRWCPGPRCSVELDTTTDSDVESLTSVDSGLPSGVEEGGDSGSNTEVVWAKSARGV